MKIFTQKKRSIPEARKKYGIPENKETSLKRQKREREERENRANMEKSVKEKNPEEYHFAYHSVNKNMVKKHYLTVDELKRILKYIDSEIIRIEAKIESFIKKPAINNKIVFSDGWPQIVENVSNNIEKHEYDLYLDELKTKRADIIEKLEARDSH